MVQTRARKNYDTADYVQKDRETAKARRRHNNRVSAQLSRIRRKEYIEGLERSIKIADLKAKEDHNFIAGLLHDLDSAQEEIDTLRETVEVMVDERARLSPYLQGTALCDKCKELV
jgi:hypothetical protein